VTGYEHDESRAAQKLTFDEETQRDRSNSQRILCRLCATTPD